MNILKEKLLKSKDRISKWVRDINVSLLPTKITTTTQNSVRIKNFYYFMMKINCFKKGMNKTNNLGKHY